MLIGRNGAGKSNALDALEVLSRLAKGTDIIKDLAEHEVRTIEIRRGGFGEVMLGLSEVILASPRRATVVTSDPDDIR